MGSDESKIKTLSHPAAAPSTVVGDVHESCVSSASNDDEETFAKAHVLDVTYHYAAGKIVSQAGGSDDEHMHAYTHVHMLSSQRQQEI